MKILIAYLFLIVFFPLVTFAEIDTYYPIHNWRTSSAEKQNMNVAYLNQMHDKYDQNGQIIVIKNGYLIESKKLIDFSKVEHIHSCTKSVISLLYGMVNQSDSVDEFIVEYFPSYKRADNIDVNIYHLLSMTSGMDWSDNPNIDSKQLPYEPDWVKYILSKKIVIKPGTQWSYNSGASQLLSVIMQKQLKYPLKNYVEQKLFIPLNISEYTWWNSNDGYLTAGWGLHLSVFDITKIGYLMLKNGQWNGKKVISKHWIKEVSSRKVKINNDFSYGYQWWIYDCLPFEAYKAYGNYGDHSVMIIIVPELNLEVVLIGNINNDIEILKEYIIPSVNTKNLSIASTRVSALRSGPTGAHFFIQAPRKLSEILGRNHRRFMISMRCTSMSDFSFS